MIKAAGTTGLGTPLALFGLSGENITRLVAGEPIRVTAAAMQELGLPPVEIVIHYGKTEQAIVDELKAHGVLVHEQADAACPLCEAPLNRDGSCSRSCVGVGDAI